MLRGSIGHERSAFKPRDEDRRSVRYIHPVPMATFMAPSLSCVDPNVMCGRLFCPFPTTPLPVPPLHPPAIQAGSVKKGDRVELSLDFLPTGEVILEGADLTCTVAGRCVRPAIHRCSNRDIANTTAYNTCIRFKILRRNTGNRRKACARHLQFAN